MLAHLGLHLHRIILAAAPRFSNEFDVYRFGKISNRGLRSTASGNSANSRIKVSDKEGRKLQSMNSSTYEEDFPPLSRVKSRRRTRIDTVTCSEQKPNMSQSAGPSQCAASNLITCSEQNPEEVQNNDPLQGEASTPVSDFYDTDLPTSFGKKKKALSSLRNPKFCQTYHEPRQAKTRSKPSSSTPMDEPFDICPPETTESTSPGGSMNMRNSGMWSPADENEQTNGIEEKGKHTEYLFEDSRMVLRPGMVLLKHYIPLLEQMNIVNKCRELGCGPGGFYRPGYNDGAKLRLYMMCLGLDWNPQTKSYGEKRQHDNALPPHIPYEFTSLVCRALDDSHDLIERYLKVESVEDELPKMCPDVCIANFYTTNGRLGLHQDRDESKESLDKGLPVVSVSIGDSAEFLYGDERDVNKAKSVLLESGDILIFGGNSRHIFHGVRTIIPETAPPALRETTRLVPGRLNLTFRKN